jgi:hypothetical protein
MGALGAQFNQAQFGQAQPGYGPALPGALFAANLAYTAYRIAGILPEPGRGYSQSEGWDALNVLNSILNSFQAERLLVYAFLRSVFEITPNQQEYKIGNTPIIVNGVATMPDWTGIPRPETLQLAGYIFSNSYPNVENPMRILSYQEWAALSPKDLTSPIEYYLYFQPDIPNATAFLWPVPTDPSVLVALYTWQNIQTVPSLGTAMILPPAYQELLEYGLAIRLAGMFPRRSKLDPNAGATYYTAKTKVMAANTDMLALKAQCELGSGGARQAKGIFNIISGTYVGGIGGTMP